MKHANHARTPDHPSPPAAARLLLLDDDEAILIPVARYLRARGYDVVTCREPEEAEALLTHQAFGLMVLDLALSPYGRQGFEVLGSVRAAHPALPVIVLSGKVCPETEQLSRSLGASAVLCKPQPLALLSDTVATLLGAAA